VVLVVISVVVVAVVNSGNGSSGCSDSGSSSLLEDVYNKYNSKKDRCLQFRLLFLPINQNQPNA